MAQNKSSALAQEIRKAAKLAPGIEAIPQQLSNQIVPTIEVNPRLTREVNHAISSVSGSTGTSTIYTTPSNQDYYLYGASLSAAFNAAADSTNTTLNIVLNGLTVAVIRLAKLSLTASEQNINIVFPKPIKIDRARLLV